MKYLPMISLAALLLAGCKKDDTPEPTCAKERIAYVQVNNLAAVPYEVRIGALVGHAGPNASTGFLSAPVGAVYIEAKPAQGEVTPANTYSTAITVEQCQHHYWSFP